MEKNPLKAAIEQKEVVMGIMVSELRATSIGHMLNEAGLSFFILDMEHGSYDYETMYNIIVGLIYLAIPKYQVEIQVKR